MATVSLYQRIMIDETTKDSPLRKERDKAKLYIRRNMHNPYTVGKDECAAAWNKGLERALEILDVMDWEEAVEILVERTSR